MIRHVCPCGAMATSARAPWRCPRHLVNARGFRVTQSTGHRGREYQELAARTVAEWRAEHGDLCPGWGVPAHRSADLTAQHPVRITDGGSLLGQRMTVLCRSCNSRHNVVMQNAMRAAERAVGASR